MRIKNKVSKTRKKLFIAASHLNELSMLQICKRKESQRRNGRTLTTRTRSRLAQTRLPDTQTHSRKHPNMDTTLALVLRGVKAKLLDAGTAQI